jgi:hypothetical protein
MPWALMFSVESWVMGNKNAECLSRAESLLPVPVITLVKEFLGVLHQIVHVFATLRKFNILLFPGAIMRALLIDIFVRILVFGMILTAKNHNNEID